MEVSSFTLGHFVEIVLFIQFDHEVIILGRLRLGFFLGLRLPFAGRPLRRLIFAFAVGDPFNSGRGKVAHGTSLVPVLYSLVPLADMSEYMADATCSLLTL